MKKTITVLFSIFLMYGCAGLKTDMHEDFTSAPLMGMIYTSEGLAASDVRISMDGKDVAVSGMNGRFVIPEVARGRHVFGFRKEGMETLTTELDFSDPAQILYAEMVPMDEILENLENALKNGRLSEAEEFIKRGRGIKEDDIRLEYLTAVYLVKTGKYSAAIDRIHVLSRRFPENRTLSATENFILSLAADRKKEETQQKETEGKENGGDR